MDFAQLIPFVLVCCLSCRFADAYDPVDPKGNIVITWDFVSIQDVYGVMVSIHNNQLYRHIEQPGWRLSWRWHGDEVIWGATGAEATEQGDCHRIRGLVRPHCCEKRPVMVDLPPNTPYTNQVANCCRGGVLSSVMQNNRTATAAFQIVVGSYRHATYHDGTKGPALPTNFGIGVPGYSCSNATKVNATRSSVGKHRHVQALLTWQVTCSYSQFREAASPSCCVSLSSFYNSTIVSCPRCSCSCPLSPTSQQCVRESDQSGVTELLPAGDGEPFFRCTEHMCPVRVHWHVKINYREYWRVKVTITNYNLIKNYSDWNLVVQHPNLQSLTKLFSFNYQPLIQYGTLSKSHSLTLSALSSKWTIKKKVAAGFCRRHGDVLGDPVLQRDAAAGRECADGDHTEEGQRLHLLRRMGVPEETILRRPRVRHAAAGSVPLAAQRRPGNTRLVGAAAADRRLLLAVAIHFHPRVKDRFPLRYRETSRCIIFNRCES
ncbi:hypothetical protein GUJ93_ZPchr0014g46940 [Zizania palustris]|uniref:COBRA C-terminal domain-containing protein n=1 Tax=Zizania palustris TaxID=103762 RepID=A0A8J5VSD3_ZIZPA|nr:hypothetical protein GUJ93_ZPchr0014g46940 [Zizania palustris]